MFSCNCSNTGYSGDTCDQEIDECEVRPCQHNSTCSNLINDYSCLCWDGYTGKNCSEDIRECSTDPCQNNATCYERSDLNLYDESVAAGLPAGIRDTFLTTFSYDSAAGYLCDCPKGFEGNESKVELSRGTDESNQNLSQLLSAHYYLSLKTMMMIVIVETPK